MTVILILILLGPRNTWELNVVTILFGRANNLEILIKRLLTHLGLAQYFQATYHLLEVMKMSTRKLYIQLQSKA